jgi:dihydrofolate reductase
MTKLKLQMQISIDGFVATGPNDEQQWVTWAWDEIEPYVMDLLQTSDTILIGRKLAVDYIPYWQDVFANKPEDPMHPGSKHIVQAKKVVFTKTLDRSTWDNTILAKGALADEVKRLKNESRKDVIVYGGSSFVSALIQEGLIDEFNFFVNPVALGKGDPVFQGLTTYQQLKLTRSVAFSCGIVLNTFVKA